MIRSIGRPPLPTEEVTPSPRSGCYYSLYSSNLFLLTGAAYFAYPPARFAGMYVSFVLVFVTSLLYHRRSFEVPKDPRVAAADKAMVYLTIGLIGGCFYDRPEYYVCVAMIAMVHDSINHTDRVPEKALRHAGMHVVANLSALYMLTLP